MCSSDLKGLGSDRVKAGRGDDLFDLILAVIQTDPIKRGLIGIYNGILTVGFRSIVETDQFPSRILALLIQCKSSTLQSLIIVAIDFVCNDLKGENGDLVLGSGGSIVGVMRVVRVSQICLVGVARGANNSTLVQRGFVLNSDLSVCSCIGDLFQIVNHNMEGAAIVRVGYNSVVRSLQLVASNSNLDSTGFKGQTCRLFIVEYELVSGIIIKVACNLCSQLERNVIADVMVSAVLPVGGSAVSVVGILDFLFQSGLITLRDNRNIINNCQNKAGVGFIIAYGIILDQIITGSQTGDLAIRVTAGRLTKILAYFLSKSLDGRLVSEGVSSFFSTAEISFTSLGDTSTPNNVGQNFALEITGEDLVSFISANGIVNGNSVSSASGSTTICKRRDCHSAQHGNCQQRGHEFFDCFLHGEKVSFQFKYPKGFYSGLALRRRSLFLPPQEGAAF